MPSNLKSSFSQWLRIGTISGVRSWNVKPPWNAVCVLSTAVGIMAVSVPIAEMMGSATVSEHFPIHEISWMVTTLFIIKNLCLQKRLYCLQFSNCRNNQEKDKDGKMLSSLISFVVALYVLFSMSLSVFTRQHSRLPAEYSAEKGSQTGRRRHREHEKDQPYSSDDSEELMVLIFKPTLPGALHPG